MVHALLGRGGQAVQGQVAGGDLVPRRRDADLGLREVVVGHPDRAQHPAGGGPLHPVRDVAAAGLEVGGLHEAKVTLVPPPGSGQTPAHVRGDARAVLAEPSPRQLRRALSLGRRRQEPDPSSTTLPPARPPVPACAPPPALPPRSLPGARHRDHHRPAPRRAPRPRPARPRRSRGRHARPRRDARAGPGRRARRRRGRHDPRRLRARGPPVAEHRPGARRPARDEHRARRRRGERRGLDAGRPRPLRRQRHRSRRPSASPCGCSARARRPSPPPCRPAGRARSPPPTPTSPRSSPDLPARSARPRSQHRPIVDVSTLSARVCFDS